MEFSISYIVLKLPLIEGVFILVFGYIQLWRLRKSTSPEAVQIFWTWLLGIVAFLWGILGQWIQIQIAFDEIAAQNNISADAVASSLRDSQNSSIQGLTVLIISLIVWGILNGVKKKRVLVTSNSVL